MDTLIYTHIHTYNFRNHDEEYGNILNSLWLVAITFWCIGYGDIVPNTYCGRGICLIVGSSVRIILEGGHPNLRIRFDQKSGAAIIFVSMNGKCVYNWFSFIGFGGTEKLMLRFSSKPKPKIYYALSGFTYDDGPATIHVNRIYLFQIPSFNNNNIFLTL